MLQNSCFGEERNERDLNFDEKPVSGLGRKKKTFEELLEEELSKEQQHMVIVIQYLVYDYFGYPTLVDNFSFLLPYPGKNFGEEDKCILSVCW